MENARCFFLAVIFGLIAACAEPSVTQQSPAVVSIVVTDKDGRELSSGTGFWVSADGKLVSNWHVIEHAEKAYVKASNGAKHEITGIWAADSTNDLVVLQADAKGVPFLSFSISEPKPGDKVVVLGSPLGFEQTLTEGLVSQKRSIGGISDVIQISAAISPGSSGSPVFCKGSVIGVAVMKASRGEGISFCIPASHAVDLMKAQNSKSLDPLGGGFYFVYAGGKSIRLPKSMWTKQTQEVDHAENFAAIAARPKQKFPQMLSFFLNPLSPDRIQGLQRLSDREYYEFFAIGLNDYYVLHLKIDFGTFWVLSRESFETAYVTNSNFDLKEMLDTTRFQIQQLCQ